MDADARGIRGRSRGLDVSHKVDVMFATWHLAKLTVPNLVVRIKHLQEFIPEVHECAAVLYGLVKILRVLIRFFPWQYNMILYTG